jgi:sugar lactone lactonase YvrE
MYKFIFLSLSALMFNANVFAQVITTFAGSGTAGYGGDGGVATSANLYNPEGIAFDNSGNLLIGDVLNYRIRKVSTTGSIQTIAGNGTAGYSGDGIATSARLWQAGYIAIDTSGNIFIADRFQHRIRKIDTAGRMTTFAGTGIAGYNGDGISSTSAKINTPDGIICDRLGNVYFADANNHRIRKITFQ